MNPEVWSVLKQSTQMEDSKMRGIQNCLIKATRNLVKIINSNAEKFGKEDLSLGMNAIGLLGQANKRITVAEKMSTERT